MPVAAALRQRCTHANMVTPRAIRQRESMAREKATDRCLDCGNRTAFNRKGWEYYMVHNVLWAKTNPLIDGMLCIGCLESRIGRILTSDDFTNAPLNQPSRRNSTRLASRLAAHG